LKDETLKYCIQDCISLYQVINKFNILIFEQFNLNVHRFATLSSLALGIYRANFLGDHKIPIISGKLFNDLRKSYTGGSTEMFIPSPNKNENIYCYDVNSLYPTVMKNFDMPIGNIKYFDGDIRKVNNKAFGFFEVEITAPDNILHPIIQTKVDTGNGLRTDSPLGN
jgi:DNA polymerase elongation subunit (family B)